MRDFYWPRYVPVAERRAKALKQMEKMSKKGIAVQPVEISGRKIAASFWGRGWCDHMESFSDYSNRLPRGRSYVRNGSVCHLEIDRGEIRAMVSGSSLYRVCITINPLGKTKWDALRSACSGRIASLIDLLRGKIDRTVMEIVTDRKNGLFPLPGEMRFNCDCPDWADMCKHVAAALYGVGARLDQSPEELFALRGVNHEELVDVNAAIAEAAKGGTSRRRIAASGIADVFGIEIAESLVALPDEPAVLSEKKIQRRVADKQSREPASGKSRSKTPPEVKKAPIAPISQKIKDAAKKKAAKAAPPFPKPLTGDAIRAWRLLLDETQAAFAKRIHVSTATVSQWEKKRKASLGVRHDTLLLLRKAWPKTRQ